MKRPKTSWGALCRKNRLRVLCATHDVDYGLELCLLRSDACLSICPREGFTLPAAFPERWPISNAMGVSAVNQELVSPH